MSHQGKVKTSSQ